MTMTDIKSMTQEEITDALRAMGEPAFRGKQVFSWLHKGATDFAEMNNLSKSLREKLDGQFTITALFDNLGKGASGAAVQNMNLMLGFEETTGLNL